MPARSAVGGRYLLSISLEAMAVRVMRRERIRLMRRRTFSGRAGGRPTAVFAPDYAPQEIAEIAAKLRKSAGLPKEPAGAVASP
jgi:hypothetical protein